MRFKSKAKRRLPPDELHTKLKDHVQAWESHRRALVFYLNEVEERELYKELGYPCTAQFAESELRMSPRRVRELLRVQRALRELPVIARAFYRGKLGWCKAQVLTRSVTPENEGEWLAFAVKSTIGEIEKRMRRENQRE